jgi:hypothetical protein
MGPMADDHGTAGAHGDAAHGDEHGGDAHGEAEALGPIDVTMWGAAVLGIALGLVVFIAFMQAVL